VIVSTPEHLRARHPAGITTSLVLANAAFQGIEAVTQLNMRATWAALAESEATLKGAMQSRNPAEFFVQQVTASQRVAAKAISYGRKLFAIATNMQAQCVKLVRAPSEQQGYRLKDLSGHFSISLRVRGFSSPRWMCRPPLRQPGGTLCNVTRQAIGTTQRAPMLLSLRSGRGQPDAVLATCATNQQV
jgi:phasin family protein